MPAPKTVPNVRLVADFLAAVDDDARRADAEALCRLIADATGQEPVMWGPSIVGFGTTHYRYASGREGDTPTVGFSPRKQNLTLYLTGGLDPHADLLARLGKHTTGTGCLYLKRLSDIDLDALAELVRRTANRAPIEPPAGATGH